MKNKKSVTFRVCRPAEAPDIVDFFWSLKEPLCLTERGPAEEIVSLLLEKGGIVCGYVEGEDDTDTIVCAFGYFLGEPSHSYTNNEIGFVYIAGIAKAYRYGRVFGNGIHFLVTTLHALGVTELRCHAGQNDPYTNRLYARLGQKIATEPNRRGLICDLYANSMENARAFADRLTRMRISQRAELAITS